MTQRGGLEQKLRAEYNRPDLVGALRATEECQYVDREIDLRLSR